MIRPCLQKRGEALVARGVHRRRAQGEARQGVGPGASVQLVVQLGTPFDEQRKTLLGVIEQIEGAGLDCIEKAGRAGIVERGAVGDKDQLVVGRHALFLGVEGTAVAALQVGLVQLEAAERADHPAISSP